MRSPEEAAALFEQHRRLIGAAIRKAFGGRAVAHPRVRLIGGLDVVRQEAAYQLWRCACLYVADQAEFSTYALGCILPKIRGLRGQRQPRSIPLDTSRDNSEWLVVFAFQPLRECLAGERTERVRLALETLHPRHAEVVRLHFFDGLSMHEIGRRWGVSQVRIQQIKQKALARLRKTLVSKEACL